MNIDEYKKSVVFLKKISKLNLKQREEKVSEIKFHLSRIIPEVEKWISQRDFQPVQDCLTHLQKLDQAVDFTSLLGDYKFSYFICINQAYVIQQ